MLYDLRVIANALDEVGLYRLADRVDVLIKEAINYEMELAGTRGGKTLRAVKGALFDLGVPKDQLEARAGKIVEGMIVSLARIIKDLPDNIRGPALIWARWQMLSDHDHLLSFEFGGDSTADNYISGLLKKYAQLHQYMESESSNLLYIPDIESLHAAVGRAASNKLKRGATRGESKQKALQGSRLVAENEQWSVFNPENQEASVRLGRGTNWCTSVDSETCQFEDYNASGPLYIIISKQNPTEKYQLHVETGSLRDAKNQVPNPRKLQGRGLEFIYSIPELSGKLAPVGDSNPDPRMVNDFVGNTGTVDEDGEFHSYNDRPSLVLKDGEQHFHNHGALYKKLYVDGTYDLFDGGVRVVRVEPGKGKTIYDGDQILRVVNESGDVLEYRDGKEWSGISTDISGAKVFWEGGKLVRRIGLDGKVYHYDDGKLRSVQ